MVSGKGSIDGGGFCGERCSPLESRLRVRALRGLTIALARTRRNG